MEVPNQGFGRELPYRIYLPPCYAENGEAYPTLYLLHGLGGDDQQWLELGIADTADELIRSGQIDPLLIVMPWQRTGLESETAIIQGLLPHVESHYAALPGPSWRAIGGLSRGGGWALHLGLKHNGRFSRVGLHSPAILAGDLTSLEIWLKNANGQRKPRLWIDIGDQDSLRPTVDQLVNRLDELRVDYTFTELPGDHLAEYWRGNLADYLRWYTRGW